MRSTVYNRYWGTGGGAETYGGLLAQHLTRRGPVELLTHDPVDLGWLAERLRLDLTGCTLRLVEDSPTAIAEAGAEADLFVNVSFMSRDVAPTRRSIYVVHFPTGPELSVASWKRQLAGALRRVPGALPAVSLEWWQGFHTPEAAARGVVWTDGEGVLRVTTGERRPIPATLRFGFQRPDAAGPAEVEVVVDGAVVATTTLDGPSSPLERRLGRAVRFELAGRGPDEPVPVTIRSSSFVPAEVGAGGDERRLGVPLVGVQLGGGVGGLLAKALPVLISQPLSHGWVRSYGQVVSNSAFTRSWVERRWGVDSAVLHPPVRLREPGEKAPIILGVGRFFGEGQGHAKHQLELVESFRRLVDDGTTGWELHLAGGCGEDGRGYLESVRARAAGYPVHLHVDATGAEIDDLYARASIFWHAAGLGVDPERLPDALEHFGIATVEAMSAGAVPVVLGRGGLVEIVRHGVDGYHFQSLDGLVSITSQLIGDVHALARLSSSARRRAESFSGRTFDERFDRIVSDLLNADTGMTSHP